MFLLVPAHPGSPGQRAVKKSLLLVSVNNDGIMRFTSNATFISSH